MSNYSKWKRTRNSSYRNKAAAASWLRRDLRRLAFGCVLCECHPRIRRLLMLTSIVAGRAEKSIYYDKGIG